MTNMVRWILLLLAESTQIDKLDKQRIQGQFLSGGLFIINLVIIAVLWWASYRGFDFSDEMFLFAGYHFYGHPELEMFSFHTVYNAFFGHWDLSLPQIRQLRIVLVILCGGLTFATLNHFFKKTFEGFRFGFLNVILAGCLIGHSWGALALSYNTLSFIFYMIAFNAFVWLVKSDKAQLRLLAALVLGACGTMLAFTKVTNVLLFPLLGLALVYGYRNNRYSWPQLSLPGWGVTFLSALVGVYLGLVLLANSWQVGTLLENYFQQVFGLVEDDPAHSMGYILESYGANLWLLTRKLFFPILGLILGAYWLFKKFDKSVAFKRFHVLVGVILLLMIVIDQYWRGGQGWVYKILIAYIYLFAALLIQLIKEGKRIDFALILFLIALPLSAAVGTNNGLSAQVLYHGVFFFLLLIYLVQLTDLSFKMKGAIWSIVILLCASQVITGAILFPYRQAPLLTCNQPLLGVDGFEGMYVDRATADLREILEPLAESEARFGFAYSHQMGMVLLANKMPMSMHWTGKPGEKSLICQRILDSGMAPKDLVFILPEGNPEVEEVKACLAAGGVDLKSDYKQVSTFSNYDWTFEEEMIFGVYVPNK